MWEKRNWGWGKWSRVRGCVKLQSDTSRLGAEMSSGLDYPNPAACGYPSPGSGLYVKYFKNLYYL